jgi:L-asparagine transporter-like permease
MTQERPRVGPWLRRYSDQPQRTWKDRLPELAIGAGLTVAFFAAVIGVLYSFTKHPFYTFAALVVVWAIGFLGLIVKRKRDRVREQKLHESAGRYDRA